MTLPRVAVVCDLREENWPSMHLVAEMLLKYLQRDHVGSVVATCIRPPMRRRFTCVRPMVGGRAAYHTDRLLNREPTRERRSWLFKSMTKHVLSGFCKAARVTCDSTQTRDQLLAHGLFPPDCIMVVPNGVHPTCSPEPEPPSDAVAARLLGPTCTNAIDILHVGSTIPRKRIDVLLRVFARLRKEFPQVRLIRVGGPFTAAQMGLIEQLKLRQSVIILPFLGRAVLAAVYRRAALVLQPSEREGFGLPVIEAMACGTPAVESDLPVLREVGGEAVTSCPMAEVSAWSASVIELLCEQCQQPARWSARREASIVQADKFSWVGYTHKMVALYQDLFQS